MGVFYHFGYFFILLQIIDAVSLEKHLDPVNHLQQSASKTNPVADNKQDINSLIKNNEKWNKETDNKLIGNENRNIVNSSSMTSRGGVVKCGQWTVAPGTQFMITSSTSSKKYKNKGKCTWTFKTESSNSNLNLLCSSINIKQTRRCKKTNLSISTATRNYDPLCGRYTDYYMESSGNYMTIRSSSKLKRGRNIFNCKISSKEVKSPLTTTTTPTLLNSSSCSSCGFSSSRITSNDEERIVGGQEAEPHSHPWQAGIVHGNETDVWCGAALITELYLLTAAHCAWIIHPDDDPVSVILGTNILYDGDGNGLQQRIPISKATLHIDYNPVDMSNDIAILKLQRPAEFNPTVMPICLPTGDIDFTGSIATASGWGKLTEGGTNSKTLQDVDVKVISHEECSSIYTNRKITANQLCAGGDGKDACQADSGGPLVIKTEDGHKTLIGITSWGKGCGRIGYPGVYVKVTKYLQWIRTQVQEDQCNYLSNLPTPAPLIEHPVNGQSCSCGVRNYQDPNRIIGGHITQPNEFPWQVAIVSYFHVKPYCGATILSDHWLVTAAHCAEEMHYDDQVMLGEHNWKKSDKIVKRRNIKKIIMHPNYNQKYMDCDIALIKLKEPINFHPDRNNIAPVCLPAADEDFTDKTAIVTGWGLTKYGGFQSTTLRAVEVPLITSKDCQDSYGSYVTENMICAGFDYGGHDACQGDSGGPLVIKNEGTGSYVLAGITSWGYKCARPDYPGVYTKVTNFVPWIQEHIKDTNTCQ